MKFLNFDGDQIANVKEFPAQEFLKLAVSLFVEKRVTEVTVVANLFL